MRAELLERSARPVQSLSELLRGEVALRALVRDAPKLARLEVQLFAEPAFGPRSSRDRDDQRADRQACHEREDRALGHPVRQS
jgi:hypothetical protein